MKKNKQNFIYQNKIILTNGASIKLSSTKYFKIYQLNLKSFQNQTQSTGKIIDKNRQKLNFLKKIN